LEGVLDEADSRIAEALEILENTELPLAWQVYATAEKLYYLQNDGRRMSHCRSKKQNGIDRLLNSLEPSDPLREYLPNLAESREGHSVV
jgi:hypothetical protein